MKIPHRPQGWWGIFYVRGLQLPEGTPHGHAIDAGQTSGLDLGESTGNRTADRLVQRGRLLALLALGVMPRLAGFDELLRHDLILPLA